jgi:hypothetical protein
MGDLMHRGQKIFISVPILWYDSNNGSLRCNFSKAQLIVNWEQNFEEGA